MNSTLRAAALGLWGGLVGLIGGTGAALLCRLALELLAGGAGLVARASSTQRTVVTLVVAALALPLLAYRARPGHPERPLRTGLAVGYALGLLFLVAMRVVLAR